MTEQDHAAPAQEVSDGAGRIVAGRFHTVQDADVVLGRLRDKGLGPMLQERSDLAAKEAHLWIWVLAEHLEEARSCMRPGDVVGDPTRTDRRGAPVPTKRRLLPWGKG